MKKIQKRSIFDLLYHADHIVSKTVLGDCLSVTSDHKYVHFLGLSRTGQINSESHKNL